MKIGPARVVFARFGGHVMNIARSCGMSLNSYLDEPSARLEPAVTFIVRNGVDVVRVPLTIHSVRSARIAKVIEGRALGIDRRRRAGAVPSGAIRLAYVPDTPDGPLAVYTGLRAERHE